MDQNFERVTAALATLRVGAADSEESEPLESDEDDREEETEEEDPDESLSDGGSPPQAVRPSASAEASKRRTSFCRMSVSPTVRLDWRLFAQPLSLS